MHFSNSSKGGTFDLKDSEGNEIASGSWGASSGKFDLAALLKAIPSLVEQYGPVIEAAAALSKLAKKAFPPANDDGPVPPTNDFYNLSLEYFDGVVFGNANHTESDAWWDQQLNGVGQSVHWRAGAKHGRKNPLKKADATKH